MAYTAVYRKIPSGYMGQIVEWPQVITEGEDLEDCRAMLKDALAEMVTTFRDEGQELPEGALYETLDLPA